MLELIVFVAGSAALVYVSRACLRNPASHGFYRFFAWELILALVLLNLRRWFRDPFSIHQLVSWFLLVGSLLSALPALRSFRSHGRPDPREREDASLLGIEKTTRLVTTGVYKYIRHPMYGSLLLLAWGAFFKDPSGVGIGLALGATAFLLATAKAEEAENVRYFGAAYTAYMRQTKMFIPFLL